MDEEEIKTIKKQHIDNYRNSILDIVDNNTSALVDDIQTLTGKPPLEAMDLIKVKFLSLAKKNKIILNTEELDNVLDGFRNQLSNISLELGSIRVNKLSSIINDCVLDNDDVIKINKKDFVDINKKIKKIIKESFNVAMEEFFNNIDIIFNDNIDDSIKEKIILDLKKYIKNNYLKQLIDNCDIKILVKDTTLINSVKEQGDHYIFTLKNSRILNDLDT